MRKIASHLECPIDNCLLDAIESSKITSVLFNWGLTPNMVTTIGNLFRLLSISLWLRGNSILFFISAMIAYFFDCLDGYYARESGMTSKLGDLYDHFSDFIYHVILFYLVYNSGKFQKLSFTIKFLIILLVGIATLLSFINFGCQAPHFANYSPTLYPLSKLCTDKNNVQWTRYCGSGSFVTLMYLISAYFA